ncbi:MAG: hypothetical protein HY317_00410 [Acidobacteria bacterium]|nr:hypothetical protein [Acidobacteriota bacterium]
MGLLSPRFVVAFDAASVSGALLWRRPWSVRVRTLARVPLPPGALVPHPLEENLVGAAAVREALRSLTRSLGAGAGSALVLLPDGIARTLLVDVPPRTDPVQFARFRLAAQLPYAPGEAVVDVLPVGRRCYVAGAVRRGLVASYETAVAEAGLVQERLDLAPLAALSGLMRRPPASAPSVDVILGDAAVSLAAFERGALRALRSRRRDPGPDEPSRLREEVDRTAKLAGLAPPVRVRVVGAGAPAVIRGLSFGGRPAEPGWGPSEAGLSVESAELAWYGAALA